MKPRLLPLAVLVLAGLLVAGAALAQTSPAHELSGTSSSRAGART
jgi:hypothetical protein